MKERYKTTACAFLCLFRTGEDGKRQILLQLRQNTGYMDGKYDFAASGHVEPGESMSSCIIREAKEEIDITIRLEDIQFLTFIDETTEQYHKGIFTAKSYSGEPRIMEPKKCAELLWADLENLPPNVIPYLPSILVNIEQGIHYDDGEFSVQKRQIAQS